MAKAVLFDMGGTLWYLPSPPDEREIFRLEGEQVRPLMASWGAEHLDPDEFLRDLWQQIIQGYRNPELREPDVLSLIEQSFAANGVQLTRPQCEEFWQRSYVSSQHFGWTLFPDVIDTLHSLRSHEIRIAIVTNRPHKSAVFRRDLAGYKLAQLVNAVVCSADVGYVKPHSAPFERALEMLDIAPGEAVMVGDTLETDINGAKELGLTTVWKTELSEEALMTYEADYAIRDLSDLLQLGLFV